MKTFPPAKDDKQNLKGAPGFGAPAKAPPPPVSQDAADPTALDGNAGQTDQTDPGATQEPQPADDGSGQPDDQSGSGDGRQPATPEEQQQYDEFVSQALNLISKPESKALRDKLLTLLKTGDDPVQALASTSYNVFSAVFKSGVQAGRQFDSGVLLAAGEEITQHIAIFAKVRKVGDYSDDDINAAYLQAVDMFRMNNKDLLDPQGAQQDLHQIQDADNQGSLDQVAPGLAGALEKLKGLGSQQGAAPGQAAAPAAPAPAAPAPGEAPAGGA